MSGPTRFSIDFRRTVVSVPNVASAGGAPNVVRVCTGKPARLQLRASRPAHIPETSWKIMNTRHMAMLLSHVGRRLDSDKGGYVADELEQVG